MGLHYVYKSEISRRRFLLRMIEEKKKRPVSKSNDSIWGVLCHILINSMTGICLLFCLDRLSQSSHVW